MSDNTKSVQESEWYCVSCNKKCFVTENPHLIQCGKCAQVYPIPMKEKTKALEELKAMLADWSDHKDPCSCCDNDDSEDKLDGYKGNELKAMIEKIVEILEEKN